MPDRTVRQDRPAPVGRSRTDLRVQRQVAQDRQALGTACQLEGRPAVQWTKLHCSAGRVQAPVSASQSIHPDGVENVIVVGPVQPHREAPRWSTRTTGPCWFGADGAASARAVPVRVSTTWPYAGAYQ